MRDAVKFLEEVSKGWIFKLQSDQIRIDPIQSTTMHDQEMNQNEISRMPIHHRTTEDPQRRFQTSVRFR